MAKLYSHKDALKELGIRPVNGAVNTEEAARILTWRAKFEQGIDYTYTGVTIRGRVRSGSLVPVNGKNKNNRNNTYKVEDVFDMPLVPNRGIGQRKRIEQETKEN